MAHCRLANARARRLSVLVPQSLLVWCRRRRLCDPAGAPPKKARLEPRINMQGRTPPETVIPLATPFIVFVDPASACNFKCTFCPTGHHDLIAETGRFQGAMKFELFRK